MAEPSTATSAAAGALTRALATASDQVPDSLNRLFDFLRIPSISTDGTYAADCRACADWLSRELAGLGFTVSVRETGGHPAVVAHADGRSSRRALFYGHYDVQPVDPLELWEMPPFDPRITTDAEGRQRIVARGACDDKGQVMTFVEACRAWKATIGEFPMGLTLLIEGEEENGSKHLFDFVRANAADLKADIALVCDTGMWDRETPAITTSLRGMIYEEIIVRAADRDLHSGLFGGAAQNPIRVLSRIISSLHDENGAVTIPGFYRGVAELPDDVRREWEGLGLTAEDFLGQVGLRQPAGEKGRMLIEMIQSRPTCDANGIVGGYTGEGTKTVIPAQASAKVSFRLVGTQDPIAIRDAFHSFVRAQVPADCRVEFISYKASPAIHLPWDMPDLARARAALSDEWGRKAVVIGSGGSIPIVGDFKSVLGVDTLLIGFGLDDDRVHSPNEKYDVTSFTKGTRSWVRVLHALAQ